MKQRLDNGLEVTFGQDIREIEELTDIPAKDWPLPCARRGIDQIIRFEDVVLQFDTGKLTAIEFRHPYEFNHPVAPFAEAWKNLYPFPESRVYGGMSREDFLVYLKVWEQRARSEFDCRQVIADELLPGHYLVTTEQDEDCNMVHLSFGPSRETRGGGRWSDGLTLFFEPRSSNILPEERLRSLSVFCDTYNTLARPKKT